MSSRILFLLLIFCHSEYTFGRECEDCGYIQSCPEAVKLIRRNAKLAKKLRLRNAFCGFDFVEGKYKPKICCSDFADVNKRISEEESTVVTPTPTTATSNDESNFDVETHPNFHLLPKDCGPIDGDRIHDGKFAGLYEFPWMSLLVYNIGSYRGKKKYKFMCGGSVINSKYILTAAHCVNKNLEGIRVGEYDIRKKIDCQGEPPNVECEDNLEDRIIEDKIPHPNYTNNPVENDIALIRVREPLDFSFRNVRPVCLPTSKTLRNKSLIGKIGTVAGWGDTGTGRMSQKLKKVNLPILPNVDCVNFYKKLDKKICAAEEGNNLCRGDSGGPMMFEEEYNDSYRIMQYGIVSLDPLNCSISTPGVYTDVTKYLKWILDNIKE